MTMPISIRAIACRCVLLGAYTPNIHALPLVNQAGSQFLKMIISVELLADVMQRKSSYAFAKEKFGILG